MSEFTGKELEFLRKNIELSTSEDGEIVIAKIRCDVCGDVEGSVWGNVLRNVWGGKAKKQLI